MAQQEGPFSEYLQQLKITPAIEAPKPTGFEGTGAAIGNIALNFLSGLQKGRQQKFMQQQMEEQKKFDAYQNAIQRVAASDLPGARKQQLVSALQAPLFSTVAADKDAAKSTNPVARFLHGLASNVVGGAPKKGQPLSMDPVVEALQAAGDPNQSVTNISSRLNRQADVLIREGVDEATRAGKPVSYETIFSGDRGKQLGQLLYHANSIGLPNLSSIDKARAEFRPRTQAEHLALKAEEEKREAERKAATGITVGTPGSAPTGVPTAPVTPATPAPPATAVTSAPAPAPVATAAAGGESISVDPEKVFEFARNAQKANRKDIGFLKPAPEEYIVDGKRITGRLLAIPISGRGVTTGVLSNDGKTLYTAFTIPNKYDEAASPGLVSNLYSATSSALPGLVSSPERLDKYKQELDAYQKTGNVEKIKDFLDMVRTSENRIKAAELRAAGKSGGDLKQRTQEYNRDYRSAVNSLNTDKVVQSYYRIKPSFDNAIQAFNDYFAKVSKNQYLPKGQTAFLDNLLITLGAKSADEMTGVREGERKIWSELDGAVTELKKNLANLVGDRNNRLTNETRGVIHHHLKRLLASYQNAMQEKKQQAESLVKASAYRYGFDSPEETDKIEKTFRLIQIGGSPPPGGSTTDSESAAAKAAAAALGATRSR